MVLCTSIVGKVKAQQLCSCCMLHEVRSTAEVGVDGGECIQELSAADTSIDEAVTLLVPESISYLLLILVLMM